MKTKKMKSAVVGVFVGIVATTGSFAKAGDVAFGLVSLAGTGCPSNNDVSIQIREDIGQILLRFKNQLASASLENRLQRRACAIAIPVDVTTNRRLVINQITALGAAGLSNNSEASLSQEVFFAGGVGPSLKRDFKTQAVGLGQKFVLDQKVALATGCGKDEILRSNSSVLVRKLKGSGVSKLSQEGLVIKYSVESCQ